MFTDMVAFSALTQRDEPLALKLVDEQRRLVRPVFGRFAGREVKTMGDGALVEFESALDATECAVEIQRQLFERNRDTTGQRIEIRIGIHVGDVVHSENDVYGDTVNIAARVEPLAEAGGVCVTGPVYEQVQNKIAYPMKVVEHPQLKNIESPVSVYRLELPWTPPSLSGATLFTGRKEELDRLKRAYSELRAGLGTAVAITGEAGVGKTRLAEEFVSRAARDGVRILRGRAGREGISAPFASWSEAVRDFAREAPNPLLYKVCADCAVEVVHLVPELRSRLGREADSPEGSETSELRFSEGILRFLVNLSREAPMIVLLDDVQWADSASLHLLEFVVRRISGHRILVVVAFRDEHTSELGALQELVAELVREHRLELVRLKRFDSTTSVQMLRQMLRGRVPESGGDLAQPVFEKSGGNPMIIESIIQSLVGEGSLVWTGEGWAPKAGVEIHLPPGIESVVRRRLAHLAPPTVDLLRQASVLGSQFSFDALQRVTGSPPEELLPRLEEAIRARILEERSLGGGRSTYAFTDRPVLETLYDEISLVRRARYHSNAARVLESLMTAGARVPSAELAHHFLRANEYEKALEYTLLAAEEAARLFAREEALRQYSTAEELLESLPNAKRRAEVLFNVGEQLDLLGRNSDAYRSMKESAEIYERLGLATEAGGVHTSIARRLSAHNEPVRALEHLEMARRLLEARPPSYELARLYDTMGLVMYQEVRLREAGENWLRAIEIAGKVGESRVEATARRMLASIVPPGENEKVWQHLDAALVLATRAGLRPVVSDIMVLKSLALVSIRGDARSALRTAEDAIEYARRGHDVIDEMFVKGNLVTYIEWRLGDLRRAEQAALEHREFVAGDPRRNRPTAIAVLADVALARGEIDRAEKLLWEGERLLAEGGDWSESAHTQIVLARCALARGKPLSAVEHLRVAHALGRKAGPPAIDTLLLLETLALLVRAHLDAGEVPEAETCLRELTELTQVFGENLGRAFRSRAEGWMHAHRGETLAAIASFEESVGIWKRLGWQYEWARTSLSLAAVYRTSGDSKRASVLTDQATEFLSKVGAQSHPGGSEGGEELALP
jgi:class 3 adenylate cyclase/tetratricopeptide (TPR) repeat protein